jgi:hypothetical protein
MHYRIGQKSLEERESSLLYIRKFSFDRHLEFSGHFEFIFWQQFFEFVLQENAKNFAFWSFWRMPELPKKKMLKKTLWISWIFEKKIFI